MPDFERFNKATAFVLDKLYDSFPSRVMLRASDIANEIEPSASPEVVKVYWDTIFFLKTNGFISWTIYNDTLEYTAYGVSLTSRGLLILDSEPESLKSSKEEHVTLSQRLKTAMETGSKELLKTAVTQIISYGVKEALPHIPHL